MKSRSIFLLIVAVLAILAVWQAASGGSVLRRLGTTIHGHAR